MVLSLERPHWQTSVWVDDELAFEGNGAPEIKSAFNGAGAAVIQSSDTLRIVLAPIVPFQSQAIVQVRVVSATIDVQSMDEGYSFTIEDRTAPKVLAAQAAAVVPQRV